MVKQNTINLVTYKEQKFIPHSSAAAAAASAAKSLQSCPTLCGPIDGSSSGSAVPGILQAKHWSGLPFPSPMSENEVTMSCPTLHDPMDCSLPGSSVHGTLQARVLEWVAIAFSSLTVLEARNSKTDGCLIYARCRCHKSLGKLQLNHN